MAIFDSERVRLQKDVAWRLLSGSAVTMFWRPALLEENCAWLVEHGYNVVRLDASGWTEEADFHREIAPALDFSEHYGACTPAFADSFSDVAHYAYGTTREATGLFLVFTGYDRFAKHCPRVAHEILDVIARQSRQAAMLGHRIGCLLQADDPELRFGGVGEWAVMWNWRERSDHNRQDRDIIPFRSAG